MAEGNQAAQGLGEKIKGAVQVAHGSGEAIRGNINNFVDELGNQATSHSGASGSHTGVGDHTSTDPSLANQQHSTLSNPNPTSRVADDNGGVGHALGQGGASRDVQKDIENRSVANQGKEEFQAGLNAFQKR